MMNKKKARVALSFGQRRMWLLDQIEDAPVTYNMPWALRLKGEINRNALDKSIVALIERHAPLSTIFTADNKGEPKGYLLDTPDIAEILTVTDLSSHQIDDQNKIVQDILNQEASTAFDLSSDYAIRCHLIILSRQEHVLALTLHHHAADGMSTQVFTHDLSRAYSAYSSNTPVAWPQLKIQYPDWAAWQRQQLDKKDGSGQSILQIKLNRAKQRLGGFPGLITLPLDRPRLAHRKRTSALATIEISENLSKQVFAFAQSQQTTPFAIILAVYALLLSRLSNQQNVVIGSPMAGRNRAETIEMVGFFVNSLVYPISIDPTQNALMLVEQSKKTTESVLGDQDLPFELIVDAIGVERSLAHTPVFQAGLSYQSFSSDEQALSLDGLTCTLENTTLKQAKYELALFISPDTNGRLSGVFEYDADLYDAENVAGWSLAFTQLLEHFVAQPLAPLCTLPILDEHTRLNRITASTGKHFTEAGTQETLIDLFQSQVLTHESRIAITCENESITYRELDLRSNQLARYLISLGIGSDDLVAVLLDRTPEIIVVLLAILKAGAAYLPMDRAHPESRLNYILKDSQARVLISTQDMAIKLDRPEHCIWTDQVQNQTWSNLADTAISQKERREALHPDHLAYLIYTSGSTGQPKGVGNTHRNAVRLMDQTHAWFDFNEHDVWALFHSIAFDFSVWEIWGALAYGGRLVIVPETVRHATDEFLTLLKQERVTVLNQTPAAFEVLSAQVIESGTQATELALRWVIFGGAALIPTKLQPWLQRMQHHGPTLVNMYGITETTVHVTFKILTPEDAQDERSPIGTPIHDLAAYVLDANLEPVPAGVIGELYIAGAGLARGYFNQPGLTACRFIASPFAHTGTTDRRGLRLYRSGDLARMLADGSIEYLGRADDQVKIRGYRIELGEIEASFEKLDPVQKALCLAIPSKNLDSRLVAYVILSQTYIDQLSRQDQNEDKRESEWESLYDDTYSQSTATERDFDITGWNSTYTRTAIPSREMALWQKNTIERILKTHPSRLLEVGCGTGLLMWKLIDHLESYFGTDLSVQTIRRLQQAIEAEKIDHAAFAHGVADDLSNVPEQKFDTAIINSVIQYFPSQNYLTTVVQGVLSRAAKTVFIGDVRSLRHLGPFWSSVELFAAAPDENVSQIAKRVSRRIKAERELVVHPAYFDLQGRTGPHFAVTEIQIKRETFENEMSRWRYDVTMHRCDSIEEITPTHDLKWDGLENLKAHLTSHLTDVTQVTRIPNARVAADVWAYQHLFEFNGSAAQLRELSLQTTTDAIDPADLYQLADHLGLRIRLTWCPSDTAALIALFEPENTEWKRWNVDQSSSHDMALTNNPLAHTVEAEILRTISHEIEKQLPAYMVPTNIIAIDDIPLTPNGKIDRKALPHPDVVASNKAYRAPDTSNEALLCRLFADVTGVPVVGLDDDFFKIGGHSLLAMRLVAGIKQATGKELPLGTLFTTPTPAQLADELEKIGIENNIDLIPGMGMRSENEIVLSYGQKRLWLLSKIEKDSVAYNMPWSILLKGPLNTEALAQALFEIVQNHAPLRTIMATGSDGNPTGFLKKLNHPNELLSTQDLQSTETDTLIEQVIEAETSRPFDLSIDIPIRALLIKKTDDEHILVLTLHHHAADGVSVNIFIREFNRLYQQHLSNLPSEPERITASYADWAAWQDQCLNQLQASGKTELQAKIERARNRLINAPEVLNLPLDHPRLASRARRAGFSSIQLSEDMTAAIEQLAAKHHTTVFTILLSAYGLMLSRLSQQDTVLIGTPVAGRTVSEIENLIGFFVNTVVLPIHVSSTTEGHELITQVRETTQAVLIDQELPFEKLVEELGVSRSLAHAPIFQAMFAFQSQTSEEENFNLPDMSCTPVSSPIAQAKYDLNLILSPDAAGRITGAFEFDADLFDQKSVDHWAAVWIQLLSQLAAYPGKPVCTLNLLDITQERQVLKESGGQKNIIDDEHLTFPYLFAKRAEQHSNALALEYGQVKMTYAELDQASNRLAHTLLLHGVKPGDSVAFMLDRSIQQIVALIAILKTGSSYVPLDTDYPLNRLAFMATDSRAKIMLTQQHFVDNTIAEIKANVSNALPDLLVLDDPKIQAQIDGNPTTNLKESALGRKILADDLVYILYTSGSTGMPKGVGLTHRAMLNLTYWQQARLQTGQRRILQYSPISFDASAQELFSAVDNAATLVLIDKDTRRDMPALLSYMEQNRIDTLYTPFVVLSNLAQAYQQQQKTYWPATILTAGEQLNITPEIRKTYLSQPEARLHNFYGPTESHVVTAYSLQADPNQWIEAAPIGKAIDNTQIYILDEALNPVPQGVVGEIYIAGENLARGYMNRPEMTASRFIACGFDQPGKRMYRSGDLGRRRNDGEIEFLGRADQQIKIRGFRVELGEIESAILERFNAQLSHVAVIAKPISATSPSLRLIAYLVHHESTPAPDHPLIRRTLLNILPDYMVPTAYVDLESLPLSPNGKLERKALPEPTESAQSRTQYRPPVTATERLICRIFSELTQVQNVGLDDNFFDLGGHSLLGMRLMHSIKQVTGQEISLRAVFLYPTPAQLAEHIEQAREHAPQYTPLVPLKTTGSKSALFCIHPGGGIATVFSQLARHIDPDRPVWGMQAKGLEHDEIPHADIRSMAKAYIEAMQKIQPQGPYHLLGWSQGGIIAHEMAVQLEQTGATVEMLALLDTTATNPHDLDETHTKDLDAYLRELLHSLCGLPQDQTPKDKATQLEILIAFLVDSQFIPQGTDPDWIIRIINQMMHVPHQTHKHAPSRCQTDITFFTATREPVQQPPIDMAWKDLTKGSLTVIPIDTLHMTMCNDQSALNIAEHLNQILNE